MSTKKYLSGQINDFQFVIDNLNNWFNYGIDLVNRQIHVDADVNEHMATIIIRAILRLNEISNEPIEIFISTYGGDAYAGLAIYDAIRMSPSDIIIHATGKIMSAGVVVFLAGDYRIASLNTTFMMHSVSSQTSGKVRDQEIDVLEGKRLNNLFLDLLSQRTKMTKKWWYRQILSHDKYMDTKNAFEYGLITHTSIHQLKKIINKERYGKK